MMTDPPADAVPVVLGELLPHATANNAVAMAAVVNLNLIAALPGTAESVVIVLLPK
jgi:hypothetical protein